MRDLLTSFLVIMVMTIGLGLVYPFVVWGVAQVVFPHKANGSLVKNEKGEVIGSELIGQKFMSPGYFHGRPSAAGNGYDAVSSGGSNLGPTNQKLIDRVKSDVAALAIENPGVAIPADLVTTSGSGLDPHISPAAAEFQIPRVARYRRMGEADLKRIIAVNTEGRTFSILGEPRVNILKLNLELDRLAPQ